AGDPLDRGIGVREEPADVAEARGAEEGVDHRMKEDVAVGMAEQPRRVRNFDSAQEQLPSGNEAMDVIAEADRHIGAKYNRKGPQRARFTSGRSRTSRGGAPRRARIRRRPPA